MSEPSVPIPEFDQAAAIPASWLGVPAEGLFDVNGHLNHLTYIDLAVAGYRPLMHGAFGFGPEYIEDRGLSTFVVDQAISYAAEVQVGETISVHTTVVRNSERTITLRGALLNHHTRRVAAAMDMTAVHVDLSTRRSTPFPADVLELIVAARHDLPSVLERLEHPMSWYAEHDPGRPVDARPLPTA